MQKDKFKTQQWAFSDRLLEQADELFYGDASLPKNASKGSPFDIAPVWHSDPTRWIVTIEEEMASFATTGDLLVADFRESGADFACR